MLLGAGANVNHCDSKGRTPLIGAVTRGSKDLVTAMLSKDPDVNHKDSFGNSALSAACLEGHTEIVEALLSHDKISISSDEAVDLVGKIIKLSVEEAKKIELIEKVRVVSLRSSSSTALPVMACVTAGHPEEKVGPAVFTAK